MAIKGTVSVDAARVAYEAASATSRQNVDDIARIIKDSVRLLPLPQPLQILQHI